MNDAAGLRRDIMTTTPAPENHPEGIPGPRRTMSDLFGESDDPDFSARISASGEDSPAICSVPGLRRIFPQCR